jgi:hypothetical protein
MGTEIEISKIRAKYSNFGTERCSKTRRIITQKLELITQAFITGKSASTL